MAFSAFVSVTTPTVAACTRQEECECVHGDAARGLCNRFALIHVLYTDTQGAQTVG